MIENGTKTAPDLHPLWLQVDAYTQGQGRELDSPGAMRKQEMQQPLLEQAEVEEVKS